MSEQSKFIEGVYAEALKEYQDERQASAVAWAAAKWLAGNKVGGVIG